MVGNKIVIGIAEDHDLVREGMVALLKGSELIQVAFDVNNGKDALEACKEFSPDILLLDIEMPVMSGKEVLKVIKVKYPKIRVIIVSAFFAEPFVVEFIKTGANAFLPKNCNSAKVIEAIVSVYNQGAYFDSDVSIMLARQLAGEKLNAKTSNISFTPTEISIITLICKNKINKEIAETLALSQRTVEWHRSNIMRKINSKNVSALIIYAIQNRLVNVS